MMHLSCITLAHMTKAFLFEFFLQFKDSPVENIILYIVQMQKGSAYWIMLHHPQFKTKQHLKIH